MNEIDTRKYLHSQFKPNILNLTTISGWVIVEKEGYYTLFINESYFTYSTLDPFLTPLGYKKKSPHSKQGYFP